jgi:hypothetical protein
MFCPYCGLDHDETTPWSSEHVIPYAMGGSSEFTIRVCMDSNNRLGGEVDRPVIEFFPVRSERFFLGLEGTDGTLPTLDLSGVTHVHGREMDLRNVIGPGGKDIRITGREITRTSTKGGERWDLTGGLDPIRKALAGKIQDQASKGKWVKSDRGETITIENLDQFLREATEEVQNPCVLRRIDFDYLWTWRFFAKLALAAGHFLIGEEFSCSKRAGELRRTMNARNLDEVGLSGAIIFPETHSLPPQFPQFKTKGFHTICIGHGRPRFLFMSLFGWLDACVALDDVIDGGGRNVVGNMQIFEIALPSRSLLRYSQSEYIKVRAQRHVSRNNPQIAP